MGSDPVEPGVDPAAAPVDATAPNASPPSSTPAGPASAEGGTTRPSAGLLGLLAIAVVVIAAAGYWATGGLRGTPTEGAIATAAESPEAAASAVAAARAQIEEMVSQIKARTEAQPDDAEAWAMLGRAYTMLEQPADAAAAFERASSLQTPDATLLVDHANALAMRNGHRIGPDAAALIERALQLEPDHVKALAMGGSAALTARDPALAVQRWERLAGLLPPEHDLQPPLRASIAAARGQMKDGGAVGAGAAAATDARPAQAAVSGASVSGRVRLSAALAAQAAPEDTVFIVARAVQGPRMPLAVLRRQVKDLPLDFTLDDSLSMSPAARLSGASSVIVAARISRSGNALPQAGDLSGESAAVSVGSTGLEIEISEVVKP